MYVPEIPIPRSMLSMGPPKHADNPMIGAKTCDHGIRNDETKNINKRGYRNAHISYEVSK
jgi:hypothetical protein